MFFFCRNFRKSASRLGILNVCVFFYVFHFCLVDVRLKTAHSKIDSFRNYLRVGTCFSVGW